MEILDLACCCLLLTLPCVLAFVGVGFCGQNGKVVIPGVVISRYLADPNPARTCCVLPNLL